MDKLSMALKRTEECVLAGAILAIAALTIANVASRTFLGESLAATEELCSFLIVIVTFVGLSYAVGQGRHIRMTAFYDTLGRRGRKVLMCAICAVTALLLLYLAWHAARYVLVVRRLGSVSPALEVPLYLVYAIAPVGLCLAALQYVLALARNLSRPEVYLSAWVRDVYEKPDHGAL